MEITWKPLTGTPAASSTAACATAFACPSTSTSSTGATRAPGGSRRAGGRYSAPGKGWSVRRTPRTTSTALRIPAESPLSPHGETIRIVDRRHASTLGSCHSLIYGRRKWNGRPASLAPPPPRGALARQKASVARAANRSTGRWMRPRSQASRCATPASQTTAGSTDPRADTGWAIMAGRLRARRDRR
jgi:hypothetical protein